MITRNYIEKMFMEKFNRNNIYFESWEENILPEINKNLFWDELNNGDGSEFKPQGDNPPKFNSIASSSALAVNSFAIWKKENNIKDLVIKNFSDFNTIEFERKFKNGLGGKNPNLDVVLENQDHLLAIECKFLEPLKKKSKSDKPFSDSYFKNNDYRSNSKWYKLIEKIRNNQVEFKYLNAVQLLKHFYGICYEKNDKNNILLYLYWEPENLKNKSPYDIHRKEISKFNDFVEVDDLLEFKVMTYQELWEFWRNNLNSNELLNYINKLEDRYSLNLI